MGTLSIWNGADDPPERVTGRRVSSDWVLAGSAVVGPIAVALMLTPWRGQLAAADNALILVVVIVAVATSGQRWAAALCALISALSFDFFLTRPYGSFRITRTSDLVTELLLLVVGLTVGDLAARGRAHRVAASEGRHHIELLYAVTELSARGVDPETVARMAGEELIRLLDLRSCTFSKAESEVAATVEPDGEVRIGSVVWSTADLGLPHRGVDLPVRGGGAVLGHFLLVPVPGGRAAADQLRVAVAIADQVGAALVADRGPVVARR